MNLDYAEQMTAILRRVGGALIEVTPEYWTEATLRVEVRNSVEETEIAHSITSEQNPTDIVVGNDEIFTATRELQLLSAKAGERWAVFVMQLRQEDGEWKFRINFEYPE
jgi:hypothetical protein